jgi:hypothetical protein
LKEPGSSLDDYELQASSWEAAGHAKFIDLRRFAAVGKTLSEDAF